MVTGVAAYARVSTDRQAESQAIEQQVERLRAYALQQGWALATERVYRDEGASGQRPACSVRGPRILNQCQLVTGAPSAIAFLATRGGDCTKQLDVIQSVRARYPQVRFAAVAIRGNRNDLRADIRKHGWRFPVGYDADGAVANLYDVAVCPAVTFAYPGGKALRTTLGTILHRLHRTIDCQVASARCVDARCAGRHGAGAGS